MPERRINPGSPEPLSISPNIVAVDLTGTLVSDGKERPGATRLLEELTSSGLQIVLMSGNLKEDGESILEQFPQWRQYISQYLWDENIHGQVKNLPWSKEQREWLEELEENERVAFNMIKEILLDEYGGKYPPLFGAGVLIEDGSAIFKLANDDLGPYGFTVIEARSEKDEPPKAWADRVLNQVYEWRATQN